jgi:hypothetical protein
LLFGTSPCSQNKYLISGTNHVSKAKDYTAFLHGLPWTEGTFTPSAPPSQACSLFYHACLQLPYLCLLIYSNTYICIPAAFILACLNFPIYIK